MWEGENVDVGVCLHVCVCVCVCVFSCKINLLSERVYINIE
jgi:hypothetical protein